VSHRLALAPLLVAAVIVAALGACGRKGPPVAPERRVPQPVIDLHGLVREGGIELAWSLPHRRVDNSRLTDLGVARVFRADDAGQGDPKPALLKDDRVAGYTEVGTVRLAEPPSPLVQRGRIVFADHRNLVLGRRYTYVVLTTDAEGRVSPPSTRLTLTFVAAPQPPGDLRAEPGEREVRLSWQRPTRLADGSPATGPLVYEILRATAADAPLASVTRTAPDVTSTTDRGLENERVYYYAVRAIRQDGATQVEGEATARVAATPTDVTPPAAPTNLVAIPSDRTVRLSWTPSPDADLGGYVVYRAEGGGPFVRVGSVRAPGTTFTDRDLSPGGYRYAVTAQDTSVRANESPRSNEVSVTIP
jgi:Prokaryotic lipoprotein-attachment site